MLTDPPPWLNDARVRGQRELDARSLRHALGFSHARNLISRVASKRRNGG